MNLNGLELARIKCDGPIIVLTVSCSKLQTSGYFFLLQNWPCVDILKLSMSAVRRTDNLPKSVS